MRCICAAYAVMRCLCLTRSWVASKRLKISSKIFHSGSQAILVFPCQTGWRYSDGNPLTGASNAGGVGKKRDSGRISDFVAYMSQPYESRSVKNNDARNRGKHRALTAASVVRCSHKTTTKCLWRARRYTPETEVNPRRNYKFHGGVFLGRKHIWDTLVAATTRQGSNPKVH